MTVLEQASWTAHVLDRVLVLELGVDPWRDSPSSLVAHSKMFGIAFELWTVSSAHLDELWSWLGVFYERVRDGSSPDVDWQTARPYTFDSGHPDDVFVLGVGGTVCALAQGKADVSGKLSSTLKAAQRRGQAGPLAPGSRKLDIV